jgi:hypothetical protein
MNFINPSRTEFLQSNIYIYNSYLSGNTLCLRYRDNRFMLFGETVAVYCENHTEHTDKVRTSQETHYFSATETNRLMLFGETVSVYCENHTKHI